MRQPSVTVRCDGLTHPCMSGAPAETARCIADASSAISARKLRQHWSLRVVWGECQSQNQNPLPALKDARPGEFNREDANAAPEPCMHRFLTRLRRPRDASPMRRASSLNTKRRVFRRGLKKRIANTSAFCELLPATWHRAEDDRESLPDRR